MNRTAGHTLPVIAIDGTAASGKGTLARKLAEHLGFAYLDTGKLYRYVGYSIIVAGGDADDEAQARQMAERLAGKLDPAALAASALETDAAGQAASRVARFPSVRAALLEYQRGFAACPPPGTRGAVLDGRDIGTVICPQADVKLFVTARLEVRAARRHKELQSKGFSVTYDAVLADMAERDARDSGRDTAPMKPAPGATLLDTSDKSIGDVFGQALAAVMARLNMPASSSPV